MTLVINTDEAKKILNKRCAEGHSLFEIGSLYNAHLRGRPLGELGSQVILESVSVLGLSMYEYMQMKDLEMTYDSFMSPLYQTMNS
jgi:hypothetical protein